MVEPIKPKDLVKEVPECVVQAFNDLISRNWDGKESRVKHKDVTARICELGTLVEKIQQPWYDIEPIYEKVGWKVEYHKPEPGQNYDSYFTFKPQRKHG